MEKKSKAPYGLFFLGALFIIAGFAGKSENVEVMVLLGITFIGGGYFLLNKSNKEKPILMSAVRIMMSGGNRDFQFDKTGIKSVNVAEFVAKVETTLTAYHKNND